MPSPFPGIDPYIEAQGRWPDFHQKLIVYCSDLLNEHLPDSYVALVEEEMRLVCEPGGDFGKRQADVSVVRDPSVARTHEDVGTVAVLETVQPVIIPLSKGLIEESRETWIEIRKLPQMSLITVVGLLSPTNKVGIGRVEYLEKRDELIERPVHIVELDLLLAGHRLPMQRPLPRGDFHGFVSRVERRPNADVYSWSIRRPLPTIPIPLEAPDQDVPLELATACAMAYNRGRYGRLLRYSQPLELPLAPEDRSWAESLAAQVRA
jgi:hypothetical protein